MSDPMYRLLRAVSILLENRVQNATTQRGWAFGRSHVYGFTSPGTELTVTYRRNRQEKRKWFFSPELKKKHIYICIYLSGLCRIGKKYISMHLYRHVRVYLFIHLSGLR